jgi:penicillin-binding protein 1A
MAAILTGGLIIAGVLGSVVMTALHQDIDPVLYYSPELTTQVYDREGKLVANLFEEHHRLYVPFEKIPSRIVEAIVAIEDTSFFEHEGLNYEAITRAAYRVAMAGRAVEGASTITQQLVKNLLLSREKTLTRKLKEAVLALRIETKLSKEEILERYLNAIYFGHGYYGIRTAAEGYFRKPLDELTLKESALLAGLPRAPSFYDPTRHRKMSLTRANLVLDRMYTLGWISDAEYRQGLTEEPEIFDDTLTRNRAPYAVDYIVATLQEDYPDIRHGGYRVESTLDMQMHERAKEALLEVYEINRNRIQTFYREENRKLRREIDRALAEQNISAATLLAEQNISVYPPFSEEGLEAQLEKLNGAMVTLEPQSGDLLVLIGGVDYSKSQFNRAYQSRRQVGSTFKPFIYQAAFDLGYSPASEIADISRTYRFTTEDDEEQVWKPTNYEDNFLGLMTAREAVVISRNLATINLINSIGLRTLFDQLNTYAERDLPYDMAVALGAHSMSLVEFSEQMTILSNYGTRVRPRVATSITDRFGQKRHYQSVEQNVTRPEQAYLTIDVLKDAVSRGTGRRARVSGIEIAGKTGTTNDNRDAWFAGFTPTTQTVVWFGNDDNSPIFPYATGGGFSAPVFSRYYRDLLEDRPELKRQFDRPEGVREITIAPGEKEIFTDISRPPRRKSTPAPSENGGQLLF